MSNEQKPSILYLVHRIPFPPNKGDKIRSFNILKQLSSTYRVFLGCFVDETQDLQYVSELDQYCEQVHVELQGSLGPKIKGMSGFITNQAISIPYYKSASMQKWVDGIVATHSPSRCLIFSSVMGQFIHKQATLMKQSVVDFVDVDSDKWRQYAVEKTGIKKWFYNREARLLEKYEVLLSQQTKRSVFVSNDEAALFKQLEGVEPGKVFGIRNGVDTDFFNPAVTQGSVDVIDSKSIAFTGAMDYWANVNAVLWFVENVWPLVLEQHSTATFFVVGSKPSKEIVALDQTLNIKVTGRVDDVRPFILFTTLSVAPLRIARGIQNKVLEALAMAKPIVLTSMAAEGIKATSDEGYYIIDDPKAMAFQISEILNEHCDDEGAQNEKSPVCFTHNREFVKSEFSWHSEMAKICNLVEGNT